MYVVILHNRYLTSIAWSILFGTVIYSTTHTVSGPDSCEVSKCIAMHYGYSIATIVQKIFKA